MTDTCMDEHVYEAQAVALYPPRPDAIMTLLHSPEFLPGTQTLLYSLKKHLSLKQMYPPEVVVLVTPNVPPESYQSLCPILCTRILPIAEWIPPLSPGPGWQQTLDNRCPGWTKLRIFGLQQYDTILYIDSDCLVLKDVSSLLELNKVYTESPALIAAAPDLLPPDSFNSGVMVVRPSTSVMESMQQQAQQYYHHSNGRDGSDTGFLNSYFATWHTDYPPFARLPVGYNAQQAMYDLTMDNAATGRSSFWDHQIASDLYIVHYSNRKKPWEKNPSGHGLETLWHTWYRKSKNYVTRIQKENHKLQQQQQQEAQQEQIMMKSQGARANAKAPPPGAGSSTQRANPQQQQHKLITQRFKQLRKQGKSRVEAMTEARAEFGLGSGADDDSPSSKVAAMFGLL